MRTREGDLYREKAIEDDIEALWRIGSLVDVAITPTPLGDGVLLTVDAKERAVITRIEVKGDLRVDEDDLREAMQAKVGGYANQYQLKMDQRGIVSKHKEEGFIHAEVRQDLIPNPKGVDVIYEIDSGPRETVEDFAFEGNSAYTDAELSKLMTGIQPRFMPGTGVFDPEALQTDLAALRRHYRDHGWLDATVGYRVSRDDTMQRLFLTVLVREGPRYRIEHIVVNGHQLFTAAEVMDAMEQHAGGWYEPEQLHKDMKSLRDLYGEQGYIRAKARTRTVFAPKAQAVTLRLDIEEGDKVWVREVRIAGNRRTHDRVIRRDLSFEPAQRANSIEVDNSVRRLKNTGLFSPKDPAVPTDPARIRFQETEDPHFTDAVVEVEEGRLGSISVGFGISSVSGLFGRLAVTHDNFDWSDTPKSWRDVWEGDAFAGGGQRLTLSLTPGQYRSDYRLRWFNPSLNDSPYSGGFDVFMTGNIYDKYTDTRTGITLMGGQRFGREVDVTADATWEDIRIHRIAPAAGNPPVPQVAQDILDVAGHNEKRALGLTTTYDTRDFIFWPSQGLLLKGRLESAGSVLGGDVHTLRETFEASRYWTLWKQPKQGKHILHLRGKVGFIQSTDPDEDVPIFERFFGGGLGSIRGFEYRGVGSVDPILEQHVGGNLLMVGNIEYFYPIMEEYLHAVAFADAGKVEEDTDELDARRLRVALGVGVRLRVPQLGLGRVPVVLDFGFPIRKERTDLTSLFTFSLGTAFAF
jgi:outer membrane protein assembly factor BamA